jgi:Mg2+-importing ATPase
MQGTLVIGTMVLIATILRFWQEQKSNQAAEALKAMVTNTATVIRQPSGSQQQINPTTLNVQTSEEVTIQALYLAILFYFLRVI